MRTQAELRQQVVLNIILWIVCLFGFIVPLVIVITTSFTEENSLIANGYRIIPRETSLEAYRLLFRAPGKMIDAYIVTILQSVIGTFISVLIMGLCAYAISRKAFRMRRTVSLFILFTFLFGGGLVPTYILNTQYLGLGDTFLIHIVHNLANAFYLIVMRTFFKNIPESLIESAKMDGGGEFLIFARIIFPLAMPAFATISLLGLLDRWNNWFTSLVYIRDESLYTLQFLLQRILRDFEFINAIAAESVTNIDIQLFQAPTESMRYAMVVVAAGPMLMVFPLFQRYFVRGLTVGSVKG